LPLFNVLHIPTNSLVYKGKYKGYIWYGLDDDSLDEHIRYSASKQYYRVFTTSVYKNTKQFRREIVNEIISDLFIYGFDSTPCEYEFIELHRE
jgi:hypothetical protein